MKKLLLFACLVFSMSILRAERTSINVTKSSNMAAELAKIETPAEYSDGGSVIYFYPKYSILKCYRLDGNRDVYIGMPGMILTGTEGNMVTYTYSIRN